MEHYGIDRKGRKVYYGTASTDAVHRKHDKVKSFAEVLESVRFIMYQYYVGIMHKDPSTMRVDRNIYGKRKNEV